MTLTIRPRFRGPTASGNGGYVAGMMAAGLGDGAVTVTLRQPPPLGVPLQIVDGRLVNDETVIAEAMKANEDDLATVPAVGVDEARDAAQRYPGLTKHPFPECFVCGTQRAPGDGLRLFPGRIGDGRTACVWDVTPDLAGGGEFVWSALDCPGGWAAPIEGRPMVLGRMTAHAVAVPAAGESCVVMGLFVGTQGRKTWTRSTIYGADGRLLGRAYATWIALLDAVS